MVRFLVFGCTKIVVSMMYIIHALWERLMCMVDGVDSPKPRRSPLSGLGTGGIEVEEDPSRKRVGFSHILLVVFIVPLFFTIKGLMKRKNYRLIMTLYYKPSQKNLLNVNSGRFNTR